jgi:hypothetical protein
MVLVVAKGVSGRADQRPFFRVFEKIFCFDVGQ